jgi:hypothetical protein
MPCPFSAASSTPIRPLSPVREARSGRITRQRQEVAVVAGEARQQAGAQKGRLARTRGAEDDEKPRRWSPAQSAQPIEHLDDRRIAAEENAGVFAFERPQPTIRRPLGVARRRPGEKAGIEPGLGEPAAQPGETLL